MGHSQHCSAEAPTAWHHYYRRPVKTVARMRSNLPVPSLQALSAVRSPERCPPHRDSSSKPPTAEVRRMADDWIPLNTLDTAPLVRALSPRFRPDPRGPASSQLPTPVR